MTDMFTYTIATKAITPIAYSGSFTTRTAHTATVVNNGIYVIGGSTGTDTTLLTNNAASK